MFIKKRITGDEKPMLYPVLCVRSDDIQGDTHALVPMTRASYANFSECHNAIFKKSNGQLQKRLIRLDNMVKVHSRTRGDDITQFLPHGVVIHGLIHYVMDAV